MKSDFNTIVNNINTILESVQDTNKNLTHLRQRGYLTGWLAKIALENIDVRKQIESRLKSIRLDNGAGSENRTRKSTLAKS